MRIIKTVKVTTAKMVQDFDICELDELAGLSGAEIIYRFGWVGSDGITDTVLALTDGQATPVELYNMDTVANGLDMSKHIQTLNYMPLADKISIKVDVNLGAGDAIIFVDAEV